MTSDASSERASEPDNNRTIMVPSAGLFGTYVLAFIPALGVAIFIGTSFKVSTDDLSLYALFIGHCVILGLSVLHLAVARIEIDSAYISTRSLLGTRKSLPLRDVASDMILEGTEGSKYLEIKTTAGAVLQIPDLGFSHGELDELRLDIAKRVLAATKRAIPTEPPKRDDTLVCFFVCLLPIAVLIVIKLVQLIRAHIG